MNELRQRGYHVRGSLVWVNNNHGTGDLNEVRSRPPCMRTIHATKATAKIEPRIADVLDSARQADTSHPTEKPVNLFEPHGDDLREVLGGLRVVVGGVRNAHAMSDGGARILVVDDDADLLRLLGMRLGAAGYRVDGVASAVPGAAPTPTAGATAATLPSERRDPQGLIREPQE